MKTYSFECQATNIPKNGNGEDASYCGRNMIIVCDGVGAWAQYNIDAGHYAALLRNNMLAQYESNPQHYIENSR